MFMIKPQDVRDSALARGVSPETLAVPGAVILTFNRPIITELTRSCDLEDWDWGGRKYTPYSSPLTCLKGAFEGTELAVFVPPMGASPVAAFCDELIVYGARTIFLLCASWSLGKEYLRRGQIQVPTFAVGMDGTSCHYGNTEFRVDADTKILETLSKTLRSNGVDWKMGGAGCCEAIYCITREMVANYRQQGCLSMENGEVAALYSLAKLRGINAGVLLQPYIDLERGYDPSYIDEEYQDACKRQARVALKALKRLYEL